MRVKLEDVCERDSSNLKQSDVIDKTGEYPIYGATGYLGNVDFYHQEKPYVAVVKDGAGIGRTTLCPARSSVIGTMQYLLPKENVLPEYLCYVVRHMHLEKYFTGATIPHIYFKDYKNEEFNLDTLDRQIEIVSILKKVENIIEFYRQELEKLDELIESRFIEMFGDPMTNPHNLPKVIFGSVLTIEPQNGLYKPQLDYVSDGTGVPILRIDSFYNGKVLNLSSLKRLICSEIELKRYLLYENDIVINRVNSIEYLGKCGLVRGLIENTVFESNMMRLHVDEQKFHPVYITKLLCSQFIYQQILKRAKKAVNQASINQKDVQSFVVYMPPIEQQEQFADFVEKTDKSKVAIQKSLDETQLLFDSLVQKYFG